jgi:hypothetical protein
MLLTLMVSTIPTQQRSYIASSTSLLIVSNLGTDLVVDGGQILF